jgi:hypothetical protein
MIQTKQSASAKPQKNMRSSSKAAPRNANTPTPPVISRQRARTASEGLISRAHVLQTGELLAGSWGHWGPADWKKLTIRGPDYLRNKVKIPAGEFCMDLIHCEATRTGTAKINNILSKDYCYLQTEVRARRTRSLRLNIPTAEDIVDPTASGLRLEDVPPTLDKDFIFAINFQVPGPPNYHLICYYVLSETCGHNPRFLALLNRFITGTDDYRNKSLKMIPRMLEGHWLVRRSVGTTPAILGTKLDTRYYHGMAGPVRYFEVEIDVGSSIAGKFILGKVSGYATGITMDMSFLIEAQEPEELPECLLGGLRISQLHLDDMDSFRPWAPSGQ